MENRKLKLIITSIIAVVAIFLFWQYINGFLYKSKASTNKVIVSYAPTNITVAQNETFNLGVVLTTENSTDLISATDLNIQYDDADSIDYVSFQTIPTSYFDETITEETSTSTDGIKTLHLVLVKKTNTSLSSSVTLNLSFKAKSIDHTATIGITGTNQVVGTTSSYSYDLSVPTSAASIVIGTGSSDTNTSTGSGNLTLRVRFQGITSTPSTTAQTAKIIIKKQDAVVDEGTMVFNYDTTATGDNIGTWTGSGDFDVSAGSGYTIFIKGPKHLQKKICDSAPSEDSGAEGTYSCSTGALTISSSTSFDFSNILLLVGDLPVQDGVVNSYDISLVTNNLGSTDSEVLAKADINLDGVINTQDYSLIIYSLSIRTDEE